MHRNRDTSSTIWRTVVFAGAMLGVPACGSSSHPAAQTTPQNTAAPAPEPAATPTTQNEPGKPDPVPAADPCGGGSAPQAADPPPADPPPADPPPAKKRPRGGGDRPTGRGFVLA